MNSRSITLDIMKAYAIVLMVYGHTFGLFKETIYLFHMPVFFMISGYCFNSIHSKSENRVGTYIINRARRLLIPYWISNVLFLMLTNIFIKIDFLTDNTAFLDSTNNYPVKQYLQTSLDNYINRIYEVVTFKYLPQLSGQTWFLYSLFIICVGYCLIRFYFNKITNTKLQIVLETILFVIISVVSWRISKGINSNSFEARHLRLPACFMCFLIGVYFKIIAKVFDNKLYRVKKYFVQYAWGVMIITLCMLVFMERYGRVELSKRIISNPMFLIVCTLSGWIFLYSLAVITQRFKVHGYMEYVGQHTMSILIFHGVAFKIVSCVIVLIRKSPTYMIASYPIIFDVSENVKYIYTLMGVALPLVGCIVYDFIKKRMKGKTKGYGNYKLTEQI